MAKYPEEHEFIPTFRFSPVREPSSHDKRITLDDLSPDQAIAFDRVLRLLRPSADEDAPEWYENARNRRDVVSLGGYAGTGKSTLIPLISRELSDTSSTAFVSFTGKASNVLQRKLRAAGITRPGYVGTIHRLIYDPLTNEQGRIVGWKKKGYPLYADGYGTNPIQIERIIVDEASMVNRETLEDLLSYHVPILLVGDHGQLKPVQGSSVLEEPHVRLEKIHRQAADNPIIQLASLVRESGDIPASFTASDKVRFTRQLDSYEIIGETYERLMLEMAVLVRRNVMRKAFNTEPRDTPEPIVGDMVICLKNTPPVYNGMRGLITVIKPYYEHWYKAKVFFPDDGLTLEGLLNRYQFGRDRTIETVYDLRSEGVRYPTGLNLGLLFDFGMALTVHKAQGSAFQEVILIPERSSYDKGDDYVRWLYTAVTRASDILTIVR